MAISFVGSNSAAANNVALPSGWEPGDLAVVFAHRDGSTTAPSLPSGWTAILFNGVNQNSGRSGYRVLQAGDTDTGTWTNATSIIVVVLRGQRAGAEPIGASNAGGAASNSMTFPSISTFQQPDGSGWALLFGGHRTATNVNTTELSGTTNRSGTTNDICAHTAEDVTGWPTTSKTVNASSGWIAHTIEVRAQHVMPTLVTAPLIPA